MNSTLRADSIARYEAFLSQSADVSWHDVVGIADFLDGRFHSIFPTPPRTPLGAPILLGVHRLNILSNNLPVVNFLLSAPRDSNYSELYFGWISNQNEIVQVFYTTDTRLIEIFVQYFNQLTESRATTTVINYNMPPANRFSSLSIEKLLGTWISVSRATASRGYGRLISDHAIMTISYSDTWHVKGILHVEGKFRGDIISDACVLIHNTLYCKYRVFLDDRAIESGVASYAVGSSLDTLTGMYSYDEKTQKAFIRAKKIGSEIHLDQNIVRKVVNDILDEWQHSGRWEEGSC
jgi:hypothetical protein